MKSLATKVQNQSKDIQLGAISRRTFDDTGGFPNYEVLDTGNFGTRNVAYLSTMTTPAEVFQEISIMHTLANLLPNSLEIFLPYLPCATQERRTSLGTVVTANSLTKLLETIPPTLSGSSRLTFFDIHTLQQENYFTGNIAVRSESVFPYLWNQQFPPSTKNLCIVFPDDGACKRFSMFFPDHPILKIKKERTKTKVTSSLSPQNQISESLLKGSYDGIHFVIIDDLVRSGITLLNAAKILKSFGVSCF